MNRIITPAILTSSRMRADKSVGVTFNTNELSDDEWVMLKRMQNEPGFLMFQSQEITEEDTNMFDNVDIDLYDTKKSPSQRLRNTLHVFWSQQEESVRGEWKYFYAKKMEQLIDHFKEKLI